MGFRDWARSLFGAPEQRSATPLNQLDRLDGWVTGRESSAGVVVSEISALQVSAVMACVSRISLDVATMPLKFKRENLDGTSQELNRIRTARLLQGRPNSMHTAQQFMQMLTAQAALYGDAYAYVQRGLDNEPIALWPLQKREVSVQRTGFDLNYTVSAYEGSLSGRYSANNILHLRPQSMDGLRGIDRLLYARNAIGLASAAQATQSKSFKNGNRMPGYWTTDESLPDEAIERMASALQAAVSGENQWRSPLLDAGLNYKTTGQSFKDAELIATRKHEVLEVCAAFNVLPAVLGIDDKTQAFASVEAMFTAHIRHTLRPWLVAWEQTIDRDLLDGLGPVSCKFDTSDMEKATTKERAESYRTLTETLVMMPSEAREKEGLKPIAGLDELWLEMQRGKSGLANTGNEEGSDA